MKMPRDMGLFHIIGIGGIGMSAIAEIMLARGYHVQGSDLTENGNVERLRAKGAQVFAGHKAVHIDGASFVIISSAVKADNPELKAARSRALPIIRRAEILAELMRGHSTVSITGTHGKTTMTSLTATLLVEAGLDPTVVSGGIINAWGSNARLGDGDWMVVEADESDGTFVALPTQIGVVSNIDPEHMDYHKSADRLHEAFRTFFERIPFYGLAIAGTDHPTVEALVREIRAERAGRRILTFGISPDADLRFENYEADGTDARFDVWCSDNVSGGARTLAAVTLSVPGRYNALNALAAIAVASELGIDDESIRRGLRNFGGVKRRFTRTGTFNGITLYDDYAHHPAEISAVLKAAKNASGGRVIAIMQPHRYTRLQSLLKEFCGCFGDADAVIITPVYEAGEQPIDGVDQDALVKGIRKFGHGNVIAAEGGDCLAGLVAELAAPGDLVIGLGAGTISEWMQALPSQLARLGERQEKLA